MPPPDPLATRIYRSAGEARRFGLAARRLLAELPMAVRLGLALTGRQYRLRYRASRLRYVWVLASPLLYALIFVIVRQGMAAHGLTIETGGLPPALFALTGVVLYQVWIQGLLAQADSLRAHRRLVAELRLPPEAYFFAAVFGSAIDLAIRLLLVAGAAVAFGVAPAATAWMVPALGLSIVLTGNAVGYLLLPVATVYRDVHTAVRSVALGLLLVSPVFYPPTGDPATALYWVNQLNPLAAGVASLRDALFGGEFVLLCAAIAWTVGLALAVALWMVAMRIVLPVLAERLG